jgi:hypothetical protein
MLSNSLRPHAAGTAHFDTDRRLRERDDVGTTDAASPDRHGSSDFVRTISIKLHS